MITEKLGCELIPAGSPQAKGRIERLWGTLHSPLRSFLWRMKSRRAVKRELLQWIFKDNPIPDKKELRRIFHEKSRILI
jgi:hypothetical protein